jgi:alkylation response protein AidB-like acyl-CoA dehydrogenase
MDFALDEEQRALQAAVKKFLSDHSARFTKAGRALFDEESWQGAVALGWSAVIASQEHGGLGRPTLDLVLLLEECGVSLFPSPLIETVLATAVLEWAGVEDDVPRLLATGEKVATLAVEEADSTWSFQGLSTTAGSSGGGAATVTGRKLFVRFAGRADRALCTATMSGVPALVLLELAQPAVTRQSVDTIDDFSFNLELNDAEGRVVAVGADAEWLLEKASALGTLLACAELVGIAQAVLHRSVEYTSRRQQFGRPVGSFQALQHFAADMALALEAGRLLSREAAWSFDNEPLEAAIEKIASARVWMNKGIQLIYTNGHQMHGAMGYTAEYGLHLYTRRAKRLENFCWSLAAAAFLIDRKLPI